MNDIKPRQKPSATTKKSIPAPVLPPSELPSTVPKVVVSPTPVAPIAIPRRHHRLRWILLSCLIVIIGAAIGGYIWYTDKLKPVDSNATESVQVTIPSGMLPDQIATTLKNKGLIRDTLAFDIYTRLSGTRDKLRAGTYRLNATSSMPAIVQHLVDGKTDQLIITFYPGATLTDTSTKGTKLDVTSVLERAGFTYNEIKAALAKKYTGPLFADKPDNTDLEGYIFADTYQFDIDVTVEQILKTTFDEFYDRLESNGLIAQFKARGFNLYQAITLASIVQREAATATDQKGVAQVFETRLSIGMTLGSDVTFIYAAHKLGVTPVSTLDSPYNTRIYAGLPPGPIATPGLSALQAVASPATTTYLYFLAGDDGKVYYGSTLEEHNQNITQYCQIGCGSP